MRAAVYLRVSSKDGRQDEANQEPDCARLCAARGWEPVWFREQESGAKERPEWRRVVEAARRGEVGAVVFWALDRTGRDRAQVCRDIDALAHFRVHVVSVQDAWLDQPPGPFRDLMLQIVAWFAQGERERLIARTKAGMARARKEGKHIGRPRASGVKVEEAVRRVLDHGQSPTFAAQCTGLAPSTVRRAVSTERAKRGLAETGRQTA